MNIWKRSLWSLAAILAAALVGGPALGLAALVTLVLTQLALIPLGKRFRGGFRVAGALILGAGFGFSSVLLAAALLPQFPIAAPPGAVCLGQSYSGVLLLALLSALVQALTEPMPLPFFLGFTDPPKAFRGLPILLLTAALAVMALTGFSGLRIG